MDRIIDCTEAASAGIETMLDQLDFTKKAFEEKGGKAGNLRFLLTFAYLMGVILCAVWGMMYDKMSITSTDGELGVTVTIVASVSSALFFGILILKNLVEVKYYKVIFRGEHNIAKISRHLQKVQRKSLEFQNLLNNGEIPIDSTIELGEDVSVSIDGIKKKIQSLEKGKSEKINETLSVVYYVAAISVGAFFILYMQNDIVNAVYTMIADMGVEAETASSVAEAFYGTCAAVAIFGGPIFAKYYFEKIQLVDLNERLIFLIAGSGVLAFIAVMITVGLVAAIIALVWLIVKTIVSIVIFIVAVIFIIAIIAGLLGGG